MQALEGHVVEVVRVTRDTAPGERKRGVRFVEVAHLADPCKCSACLDDRMRGLAIPDRYRTDVERRARLGRPLDQTWVERFVAASERVVSASRASRDAKIAYDQEHGLVRAPGSESLRTDRRRLPSDVVPAGLVVQRQLDGRVVIGCDGGFVVTGTVLSADERGERDSGYISFETRREAAAFEIAYLDAVPALIARRAEVLAELDAAVTAAYREVEALEAA